MSLRLQEISREVIVIDNGVLREYSNLRRLGVGVRVIVNGFEGFASTNNVTRDGILDAVKKAIEVAKAMEASGVKVSFAEKKPIRDRRVSKYKIEPMDIDPSEKLRIVFEMNRVARDVENIASSVSRYGYVYDRRVFVSSEGDYIDVAVRTVGILQYSIARYAGVMERVFDQKSMVSGWEYIESLDTAGFAKEISELASKAVRAKTVTPGVYTVVLDNEMVGLLLHEAFGHATEADEVLDRASILYGRIGEKIASELVTVVDDGLVEGGYYVPYDDEGVPKTKTKTVERGVLKRYLQSRRTAKELGMELTGNARAMDYEHNVLVRQTNTYMEPGDYRVEELFEDVKEGIYVKGVGSLGGEVDTSMGTFTFTAGPSYMIKNGEVAEMVRGVMLSGSILETLKNVDAVARDLKVTTSVFGGCGKGGQTVRVGDGGPHVRVKRITVGG